MKSYLSLIPISAKIHKGHNRMTRLCIIFAVFLVTAIFSMADMGVRMEQTRLVNKHGDLQGLGDSALAQTLFIVAGALFVLILIAGVLMISSSSNSNVAQRTQFFGMMRCVGMSRQQIIRFVRLEALNWCKSAVPIGVFLGIVITWGLCAALRFLVGGEFSTMPLFQISIGGIISGIIVGVVTVLIAASSPAKRAAKVSPVAAVTGNPQNGNHVHRPVRYGFLKIETALGIHHAIAIKKNLILITSSFALSIILFLSFSVLIAFIGFLMPQSSNISDINISSKDSSNSVERSLLHELRDMKGVECVFGRKSNFDIPAKINKDSKMNTVDMISYDAFDLDCITKDDQLRKGGQISKVYGDSHYVLTTWDKESALEIGDKIQVGEEKLEIAGMLKNDPFSSDGRTNGKITLITSGETFARLTGITDYSLVMVQTEKNATDKDIEEIRNMVGDKYTFDDRRDQRTTSTYVAFLLFVYGFLVIITLVTVLNIMNSISMSVSARIKQYGAMRAVGMDEHQITKTIAAEAFTYAITGCIVGCTAGLLISKLLYDTLITAHFSYAVWTLPVVPLTVILLFVLIAAVIAVYTPSKRIREISVTETINQL